MLCEAAAAAAVPLAVEDGWVEFVRGDVAVVRADAVAAAEVAFVAFVWLRVAPPWGETMAESLYWERPSWTVIVILRAVIVVPKALAFPPTPATVVSVDALWNQFCPCCANWPFPARKSAMCCAWASVYWPAAAITSTFAPFTFGCGKLKTETSFTNLQ
jgi:hypothetical protein